MDKDFARRSKNMDFAPYILQIKVHVVLDTDLLNHPSNLTNVCKKVVLFSQFLIVFIAIKAN